MPKVVRTIFADDGTEHASLAEARRYEQSLAEPALNEWIKELDKDGKSTAIKQNAVLEYIKWKQENPDIVEAAEKRVEEARKKIEDARKKIEESPADEKNDAAADTNASSKDSNSAGSTASDGTQSALPSSPSTDKTKGKTTTKKAA